MSVLTNKEKEVLDLLIKYRDRFVTAKELGESVGVTDRTIRNYIHKLRDFVERNGGQITAKIGEGYQLKIHNGEAFYHFTSNLADWENYGDFSADERQEYIIHNLFFHQRYYTAQMLAEKFYVSLTAIERDINQIRKRLRPYDIRIVNSQKDGIHLEGETNDIRNFIVKELYLKQFVGGNINTIKNITNILNADLIEGILDIIIRCTSDRDIFLRDYVYYNLLIHIAMAIKRIEDGHQLEANMSIPDDVSQSEYLVASQILSELEALLDIQFPAWEVNYIALHLKENNDVSDLGYSESHIRIQVYEALSQIESILKIPITQDKILLDGLVSHITLTIRRNSNGETITNPLLPEIIRLYGNVFNMTKEAFSKRKLFAEIVVSEDEIGYLTLHILAALERQSTAHSLGVLVVCATGIGSSEMVKARLENIYKGQLHIVAVISYFQLSHQPLDGVDLIISTINLSNFITSVPIVQVNALLTEEDIQRINTYISKKKGVEEGRQDSTEVQNFLEKYITKETYINSPDIKDKDQALQVICQRIGELEGRKIGDILIKETVLRENFGTVAFTADLAVPHPLNRITLNSYIIVIINDNGIYWDENFPKIRWVVYLCPDVYGEYPLTMMTQILAKITENQSAIDKAISSDTLEDFNEALIMFMKGKSAEE